MITWIKPNGSEITTAEGDIIGWAEAKGWKRKGNIEALQQAEKLITDNGAALQDISQCEDKDRIAYLVEQSTGKKLDLRGGLDTVKLKAIKMLEA